MRNLKKQLEKIHRKIAFKLVQGGAGPAAPHATSAPERSTPAALVGQEQGDGAGSTRVSDGKEVDGTSTSECSGDSRSSSSTAVEPAEDVSLSPGSSPSSSSAIVSPSSSSAIVSIQQPVGARHEII